MTKINKYILLLLCGVTLLFISCKENEDFLKGDFGYLNVKFSSNDDIIVSTTKTSEPIFGVNILNSSGVIVRSTSDHREFENNPIKLERGIYYINASNGDDVECGFDKPFYTGVDTVEIKNQGVANSEVVCTLSNVKVSVELDETVNTHFKE